MRTVKLTLCMGLVCVLAWQLSAEPVLYAEAIRQGIDCCLYQLIPSLYAFLILSGFLIRTNLHVLLGRPLRRIARRLLHLTEGETTVFLLSQLCGYPVGASMLGMLVKTGELAPARAARLSLYCFGGGAGFFLVLAGGGLFGSPMPGLLLWCANLLTNCLLAMLLRPSLPVQQDAEKPAFCPSMDALLQATVQAARTLLTMCSMILLFAVAATACLQLLPARHGAWLEPCLFSILDVSRLGRFPHGCYAALPLLAGLCGFGGFCVYLQLRQLAAAWFPKWKFLLVRCAAGCICAGACRLLMPMFLRHAAVSTMQGAYHGTAQQRPLLSILLIFMTFLLLSKKPLDN